MTRRSSLFETMLWSTVGVGAVMCPMVMSSSPFGAGNQRVHASRHPSVLEQLPLQVDLIARLPGAAVDVRVRQVGVVVVAGGEPRQPERVAVRVGERVRVHVLARVLYDRQDLV